MSSCKAFNYKKISLLKSIYLQNANDFSTYLKKGYKVKFFWHLLFDKCLRFNLRKIRILISCILFSIL